MAKRSASGTSRTSAGGGSRWRWRLGLAAAFVMCLSTTLAARRVHRYMIADPQFLLARDRRDSLLVEGMAHTPRPKVQRVFAADFGRSVLAVPLAERRRRLLAIDWVEDASVSRLWPDRLLVRIRERVPVAFVSLRGGVSLIDVHGVLLDLPARARFNFPVLSGVGDDQTEPERALRVRAMLRLLEDLGPRAPDASEINAADPDNLRLIVQAGGHAAELIVGDSDFGRRYENFLANYPEIRKRSPGATRFDLRMEKRILAKEE